MDKIQIIEKLFFNILLYSYLLLPLCFALFLAKKGKGNIIGSYGLIVLAVYGIIFFFLNYIDVPDGGFYKKLYFSSYTFLEYLTFAILLRLNLKSKRIKLLIVILSALFLIFQVIYLYTTKIKRLDSIPIGIETILLFIYVFYFFFEYSREVNNVYIYNHYCFWVSVGIMVYLGGTFFFNILANDISKAQTVKYWYLTYITESVKNILFAFAILIFTRQPKKNLQMKSSIPYLDMI